MVSSDVVHHDTLKSGNSVYQLPQHVERSAGHSKYSAEKFRRYRIRRMHKSVFYNYVSP
jgi:hypothetical protein